MYGEATELTVFSSNGSPMAGLDEVLGKTSGRSTPLKDFASESADGIATISGDQTFDAGKYVCTWCNSFFSHYNTLSPLLIKSLKLLWRLVPQTGIES